MTNTDTSAIRRKIDLIAECIFTKIQKRQTENSLGLYTGEFGRLLFMFYYSIKKDCCKP